MQSVIDIISFVLILGAAQGIILAIVLLTIKSELRLANSLLAAIILLFSFNIFFHAIFHTDHEFIIPSLEKMNDDLHIYFEPLYLFYALALLLGPLFYFYYKSLTMRSFQFGKADVLHFLPAILCLILVSIVFYLNSPDGYLDRRVYDKVDNIFQYLSWLIYTQAFYYIMLVTYLLYKNRISKQQDKTLSDDNWMMIFMICFGLLWIVAIFVQINASETEAWNYVWILASIFIYTTGYIGLRHSRIFTNLSVEKTKIIKYEKSSLTKEMAQLYLKKIKQMMDEEKPYLNPNLTLPKLSQLTGVPRHHLSQIINKDLNQNFFEFLSTYRIKAAQKYMLNPSKEHLNIAAIAMEVGFNSLSSFNKTFKKHSGTTPSQFIEKQKKGS